MGKKLVLRVDGFLARHFFWLGLLAMGIGLLIGEPLAPLQRGTPYFLAFIMFNGALGCRVQDFSRACEPGKVAGILALMYGVTPLAGWIVARIFLGADPELMAGQVFAAVLPAGITASVWTIMAGGDVPLALSLVVLATLLSGILTPGLFRLLAGTGLDFHPWGMAADLGKVVILPVLAGVFISERGIPPYLERMRPVAAVLVKGGMILIMAVYAGILTPHLAGLGLGTIKVAVAMFLQFLLSYLIPLVLARKLPLRERIAIAFANGVRNIVGGAIVATAHLPSRVVLPLILGLLLQNPMGAAVYKLFARNCANLPGGRGPSLKEGKRLTAKENE
ncbi:MAG: bile acid:sodium symporter family protein [Limnochordia bacterium]|jgi:BASS family bile acid:Na+ symporter|nr:bile acid:sodium symporter family protein [Bacillota bacterium]